MYNNLIFIKKRQNNFCYLKKCISQRLFQKREFVLQYLFKYYHLLLHIYILPLPILSCDHRRFSLANNFKISRIKIKNSLLFEKNKCAKKCVSTFSNHDANVKILLLK